ncbi:hypothetical protein SAMN04488134_102137 [Amphibacillus marinus]|uniref:Uncharacterized protein n=1 Tax=Amphibacillus marinus TaxID=872970 RepID=A0A1H8K1V5_9BACI|nr:hypothetical protein [Amphibacillus marinus]SEN86751.1 hypothetical protein SAMN04488134_102137 [Amphibacillus marinus]
MRQSRQQVKYFLRKWLYYDSNFDILADFEKQNMKILYSSLKQMSEAERAFLAEKYRVKGIPINDDVLAANKGMSLQAYRDLRIEHEDKLGPLIEVAKDQFKKFDEEEQISPSTNSKQRLKLSRADLMEMDALFQDFFGMG